MIHSCASWTRCNIRWISARIGFSRLSPVSFFTRLGRTERYTILEISMFEGRSVEAKKMLIRLLFERFEATLGIRSTHNVSV